MRQLYRRIAAPMDVFQQFDALLKSPEAIRVVKGYNKMARVLVEYEVLHHQAWTQRVRHFMLSTEVLRGMANTVIVCVRACACACVCVCVCGFCHIHYIMCVQ